MNSERYTYSYDAWGRPLTVTHRPDTLSEKYYDISPYVYCADNPITVIDKQGDSLFFAPNVSQEFKERFAEAVSFMNEYGTSYNIARIQASNRIY